MTGAPSSGSCYSNPSLDKSIADADSKPLATGLAEYLSAGQTLVHDGVIGGFIYGVQQYLAHEYVKGVGGNALYDFPWAGVRILKH